MDDAIAVVALTYNRLHLLQQCVENVLLRTSEASREIVIWDNASTDGTAEYLDSLDDPRFMVVHNSENIGQNAYAAAFRLTSAPYLIELDDDVIDAPAGWDLELRNAFEQLPDIGFLAANLVDDPQDAAANAMYRRRPHLYESIELNGIRLKVGPTGGGCSMTSRVLYERVGGFRQSTKYVFWLEDAAYIRDIEKLGYRAAYLEDLKVLHAGGRFYSDVAPEKLKYWADYRRRVARRTMIKRWLLKIPIIRFGNERFQWFQAPPVEPVRTEFRANLSERRANSASGSAYTRKRG